MYSRLSGDASGFGSTAGSPLERTSGRAAFDARHQIAYGVAVNVADWVRVVWFGTVRSGTPFTPMVGGDVNGDGVLDDRAFVARPSALPAMADLLRDGSPSARRCLARQLGTVAGHNSCEGPWTTSATMSFTINPAKLGLSERTSLAIQVTNPVGAADLALHGRRGLRGWGQTPLPDPTLLYVRGFDASARRFQYEVNPRFGATSPATTAARSPVRLTAMVRVDFAPARERQTLSQALARGRRTSGERASELTYRGMFASGGLPNPLDEILRLADTLRLSGPQADSLARLNARYLGALDSIWAPMTAYAVGLGARYDEREAFDRYLRARGATIDLLSALGPAVRGLLTPAQRARLVPPLLHLLDPRYLALMRRGSVASAFAGPLTLPDGGMPSRGGAGTVRASSR